jgi:hypothetical protein
LGRSNNLRIINTLGNSIDTTPDASGSGIIWVHYADNVSIIDGKFTDTGKVSDAHHNHSV